MVKFGDTISLGWCLGEEILFKESDEGNRIRRMETVYALTDCCLLQMKKIDLQQLMSSDFRIGAGGNGIEDHNTLMGFLEQNFITKNNWRIKQGIIEGQLVEEEA
jgi:CRP-like cAMP-binding protein